MAATYLLMGYEAVYSGFLRATIVSVVYRGYAGVFDWGCDGDGGEGALRWVEGVEGGY